MRAHRRAGQGGVTLVELMITIFVLAILMAVAVPSFRDAMRRGEVRSAGQSLMASLAYARSEAVTRGTFVSICASTNGASCADSASYESGWIIYAYPVGADGADQSYDSSDGSFVLLRHVDATSGVAMTAADKQVISFGQQGQLLRTGGVQFAVCGKDHDGEVANTDKVKGSLVEVSEGGASRSRTLKPDASCTPG